MNRKVTARAAPWIASASGARTPESPDMAAPAVTPPADLWARIERRLAAAELATVATPAVERVEEGRWRDLAPGVRIKPLWGGRTVLIACEPGAVVPAHRHRTFEHSLILSGDVTGDDGEYSAGDYQAMPAGSRHGAWSTRTGCRVLVQYDA
jgi:anti-sigma factor ChrR (cupin superfamily)